jgi:hypothetical protein
MLRILWKRARLGRVLAGLLILAGQQYSAKAHEPRREPRHVHQPREPRPQCGQRFNANDCSAIRGCDWVRVNASGAHRCARVNY